jgi:hypothetical protein
MFGLLSCRYGIFEFYELAEVHKSSVPGQPCYPAILPLVKANTQVTARVVLRDTDILHVRHLSTASKICPAIVQGVPVNMVSDHSLGSSID